MAPPASRRLITGPWLEAAAPGFPEGCDGGFRRGVEGRRALFENGDWDGPPSVPPERIEVLLWAPLPLPSTGGLVHQVLGDAGPGGESVAGRVRVPQVLLQGHQGRLRGLRVLRASRQAGCCDSEDLYELVTDDHVVRGWVHRPGEPARDELGALRTSYPVEAGPEWALCHWRGRAADLLEPVGLLFHWIQEPTTAQADGAASKRPPSLHVLWGDCDGRPRGWEAFGDMSDPRDLDRALTIDFRYAARDEPILLADRTGFPTVGGVGGEDSENVSTVPFATPPLDLLPWSRDPLQGAVDLRGHATPRLRTVHAV